MAWWFQRSKKIGPFRINLSKSGVGVSVGVRGARVGIDSTGRVYRHLSVPGTGLRSREYLSVKESAPTANASPPPGASGTAPGTSQGGTGTALPAACRPGKHRPAAQAVRTPCRDTSGVPAYLIGWALAATVGLALGSLLAVTAAIVGCGVHFLVRGGFRKEQSAERVTGSRKTRGSDKRHDPLKDAEHVDADDPVDALSKQLDKVDKRLSRRWR